MNEIATTRSCGCPEFSMRRRGFLAGMTAATGAFAGAGLFNDAYRQVSYGANPDGNVLVVLSLRGGSDGLSLIVPKMANDQKVLMAKRRNIALPTDRLVGGDSRFGLHPALSPLLPMWQNGTFGAVHATGMATPNRSHFDSMEIVERANPGSNKRIGWINRAVGLDNKAKPEEAMAMGSTMMPTQLMGTAPTIGTNDVNSLKLPTMFNDKSPSAAHRKAWGGGKTALHDGVATAVDVVDKMEKVANTNMTPVYAEFPEGDLQSVLANTAVLIKANVGAKVVTIDYGDWDMHAGLGAPQAGNWMFDHARHLAASLKAFYDYIGPTWASKVTVVTISEFGRRLEENGDVGVDHGYGNAMMLLGGGVKGGEVHGPWPGLAEADLIEGDLKVETDYRSVLWEILRSRFPGTVSGGDLSSVFPDFTPDKINCMT